jgi:hypothetical protein
MARIRAGSPGVPARHRSLLRRPAPGHRRGWGRGSSGPRTARGHRLVRRVGSVERTQSHDRDARRLLRDARAPRVDHGEPGRPRRRGAVCRHDRADRDRRAIRPVSPPRDPDDDRSERLSRSAGIPPAATRPDADRHAVTRSGRPFHVRTDGHGARGACVAARERPGADDCVAAGSAHRRCDDRARLGRARRVRRAGHAVRRGRRAGRDRTPTQRRGRNRDQGSVDRRSPRPGSEVELTSPRNRGRTDRRPSRGPNDCADRDCAGAASHRDPRTRPGRCLPGSGRSGHPPLVCDSGLFGSASSAAGTDPHAEDRGSARRARDGAVVGRDGLRRRRGGSTCAGDPAPQASRCGRSGGPRGGTYHLWGCAST